MVRRPAARCAALAACALAAALPASALAAPAKPKKQKTVEVQLLAINDFHGNLEAPAPPAPGQAPRPGGIEYLATYVDQRRAENRNTAVVSAGDLIGASPLLSALFHDEPTIEAMNLLGLDFNAVGNHEFDEGAAELVRMQEGGCHPADGCLDGTPFGGADFGFLAANVVREADGRTLFPPYAIRSYRGEKVAFIGMTLEDTPGVVSPSGVAGLDFRDEADTVNALVPRLRRMGAETIVVLVHEGGSPVQGGQCVSGPIRDIVERTSDEVDVFVTGHTHQVYNCIVDGRPVTSSGQYGRGLTDIDLTIDRRTGEPTAIRADNVSILPTVAKDPRQTELIERYDAVAAPLRDRVIGQAAATITRTADGSGESALGNVIADAQLAATQGPGQAAQIAFMNPGGIRADLEGGPVTYGEAFAVQPFGNTLVTLSLTGQQILTLLDQQVSGANANAPRILQPSKGFAYTLNVTQRTASGAVAKATVVPGSVTLNGAPLDPAATYRVTVNSFLADGGDGFPVLTQGGSRVGGGVDLDAFEAFLQANPSVQPGARDRISTTGL